ncbi:hypothetical protein Ndes2526B_g01532 [Nannochloris sp. 'desiccata']
MASLQSSMDAYAAQGRNCSPRQHLFFRDVENYLTFIETRCIVYCAIPPPFQLWSCWLVLLFSTSFTSYRQPDARDDVLDDVINMEDVFRPCRMALTPGNTGNVHWDEKPIATSGKSSKCSTWSDILVLWEAGNVPEADNAGPSKKVAVRHRLQQL